MAMAVYGVAMSVLGVVLVEITSELSLKLTESALFISTNFLGFLLFVFIGGAVAEHFGKVRILKISLVFTAVFALIFSLSHSYAILLVSMFFLGGFGGLIESVGSSLIAQVNHDKSSKYLNIAQVFLCIGAVIGPILGGTFIAYQIGWRKAYYFIAILSLICLFFSYKINNEKTHDLGKFSRSQLKQVLGNKWFLLMCLCMFLYTGTEVSVWGRLSTFLTSEAHLTILSASFITATFFLMMLIGRLISGKLINYFDVKTVVIWQTVISIVAIILISLIINQVFMFLAVGMLGLALSSLYPFILSIGGKMIPSTLAYAILVGAGGIGTVVIPWCVGIVGDLTTMRVAIATTSVLIACIAIIIFALKHKDRLKKYERC